MKKRLLTLVVTISLAFCLTLTAVAARPSARVLVADPVNGRITVENPRANFDLVTLPAGTRMMSESVWQYYQTVTWLENTYNARTPYQHRDSLWLSDRSGDAVYYFVWQNETAQKRFDRFCEGDYPAYAVTDGKSAQADEGIHLRLPLDSGWMEMLREESSTAYLTRVSYFGAAENHVIWGLDDETDTPSLAKPVAAVVTIQSNTYLIPYQEAWYGDAILKNGTLGIPALSEPVLAYRLNEELADSWQLIVSKTYSFYRTQVYYEEDQPGFDSTPVDGAPVEFWIFYSLMGFVLPAVPLVFGLVLPHTKRTGHDKRWYGLAIAASVWIIGAIVMMIILL